LDTKLFVTVKSKSAKREETSGQQQRVKQCDNILHINIIKYQINQTEQHKLTFRTSSSFILLIFPKKSISIGKKSKETLCGLTSSFFF